MKLKKLSITFFIISIALNVHGQPKDLIRSIDERLTKREISINSILSDTVLMYLHSLTEFREVIKRNAKAEKISLISTTEPGTKVAIKSTVVDKSGNAQANKLVYVYQTSSQGWYSDTTAHILQNEGDRRHARLFGYFKTDPGGKFEFTTIKPQGYPHSNLPAHIHIEIMIGKGQNFITELQFDDDPRLVGEIRARSIKENYLIVKNTGTKDNPYTLTKFNFPIK